VKRLLVLVAVGALSAGVSGCNLSPLAATVNGTTISQAQLQDQLTVVSNSTVAQCALTIQEAAGGGSLPPVAGTGQATVSTQFAAFFLNGLVQQTLEQNTLAARHAGVTASDIAAARQDYEAQLAAAAAQVGSPCNLTGAALIARLPKAFVDQQAVSLANQEKLEEVAAHVDVSPAAVRAYYDSHQSEVTQLCLNLLIATDQASAQAIHDQIAGGATFAAAAQGSGVNSNSPAGGAGPCVYPSDVVSQLGATTAAVVEALPDGGLAPPQGIVIPGQTTGTSSTVWIVVGVRQRQLVSFGDTESGLRRELLANSQASLTAALSRVVKSARVELDPRYGSWSSLHGVTAPTPPRPAFVLNPAIDGSSSSASILGSQPSGQSSG
jgi:hypothetical protein